MLSLPQDSQEVWEMPRYPPMYRHMPQFQKSRTGVLPVEGKVKVLVEKNGEVEERAAMLSASIFRPCSLWQTKRGGL